MTTRRVRVYLYERRTKVATRDTNLDTRDPVKLRKTLEEMVTTEKGDLLRDLSIFRIVVHNLTGQGTGRVLARCRVDASGTTVVTF